jgi:A/G-specific adenine glycosylase
MRAKQRAPRTGHTPNARTREAGAPPTRTADGFSRRLLAWFERHGRKDLPWQRRPEPYRVWVSEIMLQQTQVATVVPYYEHFMARFPDLSSLAAAPVDEVLHLWSGLGYYARARNLHRAAQIVCERHGGALPTERETLESLPGIGRSTAGAILALACGQRHPILDGNVRRVLCRYHGIEGWPGEATVAHTLWDLAEAHTPPTRVAAYTQAIMDLGATLCTRTRPACTDCPVAGGCHARAQGRQQALPAPRPAPERPLRHTRFLILRRPDGRVLLERRPPSGVWGGLWSFPECALEDDVHEWCRRTLGRAPHAVHHLPVVHHGFTHFRLDIDPILAEVAEPAPAVMEADRTLWYAGGATERLGLAAPVAGLLSRLPQLNPEETWRAP